MNIQLNSFRQNEDDITVFFTLIDGENTFKWHGDIDAMPAEDIPAYMESQIKSMRCGIYRKQYRDAIVTPIDGETMLDAWKRWEGEGCRNYTTVTLPEINADISEVDDPAQGQEAEATTTYTVIEKKAWKDTH